MTYPLQLCTQHYEQEGWAETRQDTVGNNWRVEAHGDPAAV
jgi:hypothetical protein